MSFKKKVRFVNNSVNISFVKEPFSSKEILVFIPGGPGLSSSYLKPFCKILSDQLRGLTTDIALMDLPNHNLSTSFSTIDFSQASQLINSTLNELKLKYKEVSVFAHSLGGCLLLGTSSQKNELKALFMCDVPYEYKNSILYEKKKSSLNLQKLDVRTDKDFIDYFKMIAPLYFHDLKKFNHDVFWSEGCFYTEGERIMTNAITLSECIKSPPHCKTLSFIEGVQDLVLPDTNIQKFKLSLPNSFVHLIKEAGHFPFIENPNPIVSIIANVFSRSK